MSAKALVIAGYGLNCEEETAFAFSQNGFETQIRHINDLTASPGELKEMQILCVPGGFSYGDDTGSGNAFAQKMRLTLMDHLRSFIERDTLTLGICNGCQILINLGLAPAFGSDYGTRAVAVTHNLTARYQCRWVDVGIEGNNSPWLRGLERLHVPVAHGEGRFMMAPETLKKLTEEGQIAARYVKPNGQRAQGEFPYNPNGSTEDIAAITDPTGRVLAIMPHPERGMFTWQRDDYARLKDDARRHKRTLDDKADGMTVFENAGHYFEVSAKAVA